MFRNNNRTDLRSPSADTAPKFRSSAARVIFRTLAGLGGLLWLCIEPGPTGCGTSDEFECEEAAKHLENCCQKSTLLRCRYVDHTDVETHGCNKTVTHHHTDIDFQLKVSLCVRNASCDDLRIAGACDTGYWYEGEICTTPDTECTDYDGLSESCGGFTTTVSCTTPKQSGSCSSYRPLQACTALSRLSCY